MEAKGIDLASIQDEVEEIVPYARKYLDISTESYQKMWYKQYTCPLADSKWPGLLRVSQLIFSLPFSNGHVERLFSTLKLVKTERRTQLQMETLSDLLEIRVEGPPLANFSPDQAISLWWKECKTTRRTNQNPGRIIDRERVHHQLKPLKPTTSALKTGMSCLFRPHLNQILNLWIFRLQIDNNY